MQKICVYAICKNEIKFIDKWLDNMSEADYIVVLDTGSTDGTFEKLQQDPRVTRVEQEIITPWRFDVARNKSMNLVPDDADILVCTDFDELFEPGWAKTLKDNWVPGYHNRCRYTYAWGHGDLGEPQFELTYDKIHTKKFHWQFPVHEVVMPDCDIEEVVLHVGDKIYLHHWQDPNKSRENYLELLQIAVEENPSSSHMHLLYAREHIIQNQLQNALILLLKTLEIEDINSADGGLVLLQTLYYISLVCFSLKDYDECIWYSQEFIKLNTSYREPYFLMARAYCMLGLFTLAESCVLTGIKYSVRKKDWVESESSWYLEDHVLLGRIYLSLGNYKEAIPHLKESLKFKPKDTQLLQQYIYCLEHEIKN